MPLTHDPGAAIKPRIEHTDLASICVTPLRSGEWHVSIRFGARHSETIIIAADAPGRLFAPVGG